MINDILYAWGGDLKKKLKNILPFKKYKNFLKLKVTDGTNTVETSYI